MRQICGLSIESLSLKLKIKREWIELLEQDQFQAVSDLSSLTHCELYLKSLFKEYASSNAFACEVSQFDELVKSMGAFLREKVTVESVNYRKIRKHLGRIYFSRAAM